jgi:hypothetical protein
MTLVATATVVPVEARGVRALLVAVTRRILGSRPHHTRHRGDLSVG